MASEDPSPMPLLDDWIAEVGEDEVEEIIRAGLAEVENRTARDHIDKAVYAAWVAGSASARRRGLVDHRLQLLRTRLPAAQS